MNEDLKDLTSLGKSRAGFERLETFPTPPGRVKVTCISDEVTSLCPVTGQPDWYKVTVTYEPDERCVESKTLKLYLQKWRNEGHFCERFASIIAHDLKEALQPLSIRVIVEQKPRGGVAIIAEVEIS